MNLFLKCLNVYFNTIKEAVCRAVMLLLYSDTGDALITVATGSLSSTQAERTGLVSTHAYAVLDVKQVKVFNLLKISALL